MTIIAATPEATAWYSAGRLETDRVAISRCTTSSGSRAGEGDGGGGIGFVGAGASRKAACRRSSSSSSAVIGGSGSNGGGEGLGGFGCGGGGGVGGVCGGSGVGGAWGALKGGSGLGGGGGFGGGGGGGGGGGDHGSWHEIFGGVRTGGCTSNSMVPYTVSFEFGSIPACGLSLSRKILFPSAVISVLTIVARFRLASLMVDGTPQKMRSNSRSAVHFWTRSSALMAFGHDPRTA